MLLNEKYCYFIRIGAMVFFASFIYYSRKIIIQNAGHRCIRNNVPHKIITKLKNLRSDAWLCVCEQLAFNEDNEKCTKNVTRIEQILSRKLQNKNTRNRRQ